MAHDPALEAAILESRGDPEPYLVYADWLSSRGDPRGELIALQHRAELEPENGELLMYRDEYLRRHPGLRPALDMWQVQLRWRRGFIEHASVEDQSAAELQELLDHPSCRLLRELKIVSPYAEGPALARVLLATVRPSLESVTLEQSPREPDEPAYAPDAGSWSRLPRLSHLAIEGHALTRSLENPTLQSLDIVHGDPFGIEPLWNLPAVTTLSWRSLPWHYPFPRELGHFTPLWSANVPSLRHLYLGSRLVSIGLLEHDGFLRLLPGLETLRIVIDTANEAAQLRRHATRLAHLRELHIDVALDSALEADALWARLQEALPNLSPGHSHHPRG